MPDRMSFKGMVAELIDRLIGADVKPVGDEAGRSQFKPTEPSENLLWRMDPAVMILLFQFGRKACASLPFPVELMLLLVILRQHHFLSYMAITTAIVFFQLSRLIPARLWPTSATTGLCRLSSPIYYGYVQLLMLNHAYRQSWILLRRTARQLTIGTIACFAIYRLQSEWDKAGTTVDDAFLLKKVAVLALILLIASDLEHMWFFIALAPFWQFLFYSVDAFSFLGGGLLGVVAMVAMVAMELCLCFFVEKIVCELFDARYCWESLYASSNFNIFLSRPKERAAIPKFKIFFRRPEERAFPIHIFSSKSSRDFLFNDKYEVRIGSVGDVRKLYLRRLGKIVSFRCSSSGPGVSSPRLPPDEYDIHYFGMTRNRRDLGKLGVHASSGAYHNCRSKDDSSGNQKMTHDEEQRMQPSRVLEPGSDPTAPCNRKQICLPCYNPNSRNQNESSEGETPLPLDDEHDLMTKFAPFFKQQIEDALEPLLGSVAALLQSRGEELRMRREKFLALEEKKLALRREKIQLERRQVQPTRRASPAKPSQLRIRRGLRLKSLRQNH